MALPLPVEKKVDPEQIAKVSILIDNFLRTLAKENYRIEFPTSSPMFRINGYNEGELFLALRCRVFKIKGEF